MSYTEDEVHIEGIVAIILDNVPDVYIVSNTAERDIHGHPKSTIVLVDTDDRQFKVTVTTEEVKDERGS